MVNSATGTMSVAATGTGSGSLEPSHSDRASSARPMTMERFKPIYGSTSRLMLASRMARISMNGKTMPLSTRLAVAVRIEAGLAPPT